jgi:hypothetical protein
MTVTCDDTDPVEPARHGEDCAVGMRARLDLWSDAGVFVRVWEYEVPGDRAEAFTALESSGPDARLLKFIKR